MLNSPSPLTPYYGGKSGRMGQIIANKIANAPHRIYVEPYAGMFSVLLAKAPSKIEVINDLFDGIVNLFRVVRDPLLCRQLVELLELTPYARAEFTDCKYSWQEETEPVEKARKVYTLLSQNFVGDVQNGSWSFGGVKCDYNVAQTFYNSLENIKAVSRRLHNVQIESQPALKVLTRWDSPQTVCYIDPPYLFSTRGRTTGKRYAFEMTDEQHEELLDWCVSAQSKIILSGYPSELYTTKLESIGWVREDYTATASSAMQSLANGLKGRPADIARRTESLWISPKIARNKTLWELGGLADA